MKRTARWWAMSGCAIMALILAGCDRLTDKAADAKSAPKPLPEVTVAKPEIREVTDYYEFPGETGAVGEVDIRARVTGYLVNVNFVDGQYVKKGDLLYEIDPRPYKAALDRANGELAQWRAQVEKAKADLARSKRLRPSGAVSEDEYEQHVATLAVREAMVASAEAAQRDAEINLEFTKITSPIDGRVSRTRVTEGNLVQPGTNNETILTTVVTTNPIYVYFNMDEPTLLRYEEQAKQNGLDLHPDRLKERRFPVEIGLPSEKDFPHAGVLDFADNKVDRHTGTLRVRGVFDNTKEYLTPGMFVHVRIPFGVAHQALLVSERAIGADQKQKYLLTVNPENVVEYRRVTVGRLIDGRRVIESGLTADDLVIVDGLLRARPGATVQPMPAEQKPQAVAATPPEKQKAD